MTAGRSDWARVDALLEQALDLPPDARDAFLDEACEGDEALRAAVARRLDAEARSDALLAAGGAVLSRAVLRDLAGSAEAGPELGAGDRVGRYRIVEVIGRGGMSVVYRARRDDGAFQQEVALKLLKDDGRAPGTANKLRTERQILASLSHPSLAKVFDGGQTEDGRPYLVVELVEGRPLDRYAEEEALDLEGRLRLFVRVAEAVQYAHRNLVVHRDLKPSNILVLPGGRVKLLDFGIARILEGPGAEADATVTGPRWLTPRYAAPEQIQGGAVTTATDVYALGVLLYQLLTGHVPFGRATSMRYEIEKAVCEAEPEPPSSAPEPDGVAGADRDRDLDAIVLMALHKDPEQRYGSPAEMAEDVERHLTGFPVRARTASWAYRAGRFARRHVVGVSVAAGFLALLVSGGVGLALQQAETVRERDRANAAAALARQEAAEAEAVIAFLADVFKGGDPGQAAGDTLTALGLVEWAERRVDAEFEDQPGAQAALLGVLGDAYQNLGFAARGEPLLRRAVGIADRVHGAASDEHVEALLRLGTHHAKEQNWTAALEMASAALTALGDSAGSRPEVFADALTLAGVTLRDLQRPDSAATVLERAVEVERAAGLATAERHTETLMALAYIRRGQGRLDEAAAAYREGMRLYRDRGDRGALAGVLNNLAFTLGRQGRGNEAVPLYREALDIHTERYGRGHPAALMTGSNLAGQLERLGRVDAADSVTTENVRAARALWRGDHWRIASNLASLGSLRMRAGRMAEAEAPLLEAWAMYERTLGEDHIWTRIQAARVGALRLLQGREEEGRAALDALYDQLVVWSEEGGGVRVPATRRLVEPLIFTLEGSGLAEEAARYEALQERYRPNG